MAPNKQVPLVLTVALQMALDLALEKHMTHPGHSPNSSSRFVTSRDARAQHGGQLLVFSGAQGGRQEGRRWSPWGQSNHQNWQQRELDVQSLRIWKTSDRSQ